METINRTRLHAGTSVIVTVASTVKGVTLWKAHPVLGGLLGFFIVGPAINTISASIIKPDYKALFEMPQAPSQASMVGTGLAPGTPPRTP